MLKVSFVYLVASEAKYHSKCLVVSYNVADQMNASEEVHSYTTEMHYTKPFAELVALVKDTDGKKCSPVFKLSNL